MGTPKEVEGAVHELVSTAKNTIENRRSEVRRERQFAIAGPGLR